MDCFLNSTRGISKIHPVMPVDFFRNYFSFLQDYREILQKLNECSFTNSFRKSSKFFSIWKYSLEVFLQKFHIGSFKKNKTPHEYSFTFTKNASKDSIRNPSDNVFRRISRDFLRKPCIVFLCYSCTDFFR